MTHEAARGGAHHHLDTLPFALAVVRERRIVYANLALLELLGCLPEHLEGLLVEASSEGCGTRETVLHTPLGERHVELTFSPSGLDLLALVKDLSGRRAQRRVLRRLAELGASLPGLTSEEEVTRRLFDGLAALELSHAYLAPVGEKILMLHAFTSPGDTGGMSALRGHHLVDTLGSWCPLLESAWREGAGHAEDLLTEAEHFIQEHHELLREYLLMARHLRGVCVRIDGEGGSGALLVVVADWLSEEELPSLRLFAAQVSAALTAARTISRLAQRNRALGSLNRLAVWAATAGQPRDLFGPGVAEVCAFLGCASGFLYLRAERGDDEMELAWQQGLTDEAARAYHRANLSHTLREEALESGLTRVLDVEDFTEPMRSRLYEAGRAAVVMLSLRLHSHTVGLLVLTFNHKRELSALERETLMGMGVHFAGAIESHRLLQEMSGRAEELTRLHSEVKQTQRQLVERERLAALGELSAVVAHEVRNPLGAIFNALATLRRFQEPSSPSLVLVGILAEEAERLNRLVEDLLDFARPMQPKTQPVPLVHLLQDAVHTAAIGQSRLQVEWALEPDVPAVPVDERMMRQVFLNLVLNAVQAMPQGGTLRIVARRSPAGPGATVEFTDSGPGIPAALRERLFEPFFTTKATGTGLGLSIVQRTLRAHGGQVSIESPSSGGTTVRLVLPLAEEALVRAG